MSTVSQDNYVMEMQVHSRTGRNKRRQLKEKGEGLNWAVKWDRRTVTLCPTFHLKAIVKSDILKKTRKETAVKKPLSFNSTAPPIAVRRHTGHAGVCYSSHCGIRDFVSFQWEMTKYRFWAVVMLGEQKLANFLAAPLASASLTTRQTGQTTHGGDPRQAWVVID